MRILTLTNLFPNPIQPQRAVFNRRQLRLLAEHHEVRVIAPIAWPDEFRAWWSGAVRLPEGRRVTLDGLTVDHPHYYYPPGMLRNWHGDFYRWSIRRSFEEAVADFYPDLIFTPWAYPDGWAAIRLGHSAGLPVVVKSHGSDVLLLGNYPAKQRKTVEALRQADGVIAVSQDLAERIRAFGVEPERIHVVYDGVEAKLFHPKPMEEARRSLGLPNECPMILFVGNLVPVKGIDVLIDACALLASKGIEFTCNLIGQGPLRNKLERRTQRLGLERQVRLVGPVQHELLRNWYCAANVFALASHSEGVPNVLLESAACGTPFVASKVGGVPEIAHLVASRLVPAGDAAAMADALAVFLQGSSHPRKSRVTRASEEAVTELVDAFEKARERFQRKIPAAVGAATTD
jgi:glycosyltransferase involved in cell wall biosynthesis